MHFAPQRAIFSVFSGHARPGGGDSGRQLDPGRRHSLRRGVAAAGDGGGGRKAGSRSRRSRVLNDCRRCRIGGLGSEAVDLGHRPSHKRGTVSGVRHRVGNWRRRGGRPVRPRVYLLTFTCALAAGTNQTGPSKPTASPFIAKET